MKTIIIIAAVLLGIAIVRFLFRACSTSVFKATIKKEYALYKTLTYEYPTSKLENLLSMLENMIIYLRARSVRLINEYRKEHGSLDGIWDIDENLQLKNELNEFNQIYQDVNQEVKRRNFFDRQKKNI